MIGTGIRWVRKIKKINQKTLAKKIKTTASYLSEVETGSRTPTLEFVGRISKALDVPVSVIAFYGLERKDVAKNKREIFDSIAPAVEDLISQLFETPLI